MKWSTSVEINYNYSLVEISSSSSSERGPRYKPTDNRNSDHEDPTLSEKSIRWTAELLSSAEKTRVRSQACQDVHTGKRATFKLDLEVICRPRSPQRAVMRCASSLSQTPVLNHQHCSYVQTIYTNCWGNLGLGRR